MEQKRLLKRGDKVRVLEVDVASESSFTVGKIYEIGGNFFEDGAESIDGTFSVVHDDKGFNNGRNYPYVKIELVEKNNSNKTAISILKDELQNLNNQVMLLEEDRVKHRRKVTNIDDSLFSLRQEIESLSNTIKLLEETSGESQKD